MIAFGKYGFKLRIWKKKGTSLRKGAEKGRCPFCNKDYH
jgi:hypothetical protein